MKYLVMAIIFFAGILFSHIFTSEYHGCHDMKPTKPEPICYSVMVSYVDTLGERKESRFSELVYYEIESLDDFRGTSVAINFGGGKYDATTIVSMEAVPISCNRANNNPGDLFYKHAAPQ